MLVCDDDAVKTATDRSEAGGLSSAQRARAVGCVVAAATGDALGAPYEFQAPIPASDDVGMVGGGILGWDVGEWTDDTAMAIVLLEAAAASPLPRDLRLPSTLDHVARDWYSWSLGTPDIGQLTSHVVRRAVDAALQHDRTVPLADDYRQAALEAYNESSNNAGNGALMRSHVVALPYLLRSDEDLHEAVLAVCHLTHRGDDVEDACLLWTFAVRHAILTGALDLRVGMSRLRPERVLVWERRISEAEAQQPSAFPRNGWVVHAFQAAWSAISHVLPLPEGRFAQRESVTAVLEGAVRAGYDTDTVACIAGALIGAVLGPKSVQPEWRRSLFGWPGYEVDELVLLAERVSDGGAAGLDPVTASDAAGPLAG